MSRLRLRLRLPRPLVILGLLTIAALVVAVEPAARAGKPSVQIYTDPNQFQGAIAGLGTPTVIDFEDIDASPVNNSLVGRPQFDGNTYAKKGIRFSNPNFPLYIAPGGLCLTGCADFDFLWNPSNSLSVGEFPFPETVVDTNDDDLVVQFLPRRVFAAGFTLVDNGTPDDPTEYVQFLDPSGRVIAQVVGIPSNFVGIVSVGRPITTINIVENPNDGDDVDYDDFVFVSRGR